MVRRLATGVAAFALVAGAAASLAKPPDTWDGLHIVKSKRMDVVYLLPEADFRPYTKVMIDTPEVAFRKNWQRNMNTSEPGMTRISDEDAAKIIAEAREGWRSVLTKAYQQAGYQVVSSPGPDVLRISTAIINLYLNAPERMSPGITHSYAPEAGEATLAIEARDSVSGALLGRAIDERTAGDDLPYPAEMRNRASNRADFEELFREWAKISIKGLAELKELSPIDSEGRLAR